jgi:hypothetical protein
MVSSEKSQRELAAGDQHLTLATCPESWCRRLFGGGSNLSNDLTVTIQKLKKRLPIRPHG